MPLQDEIQCPFCKQSQSTQRFLKEGCQFCGAQFEILDTTEEAPFFDMNESLISEQVQYFSESEIVLDQAELICPACQRLQSAHNLKAGRCQFCKRPLIESGAAPGLEKKMSWEFSVQRTSPQRTVSEAHKPETDESSWFSCPECGQEQLEKHVLKGFCSYCMARLKPEATAPSQLKTKTHVSGQPAFAPETPQKELGAGRFSLSWGETQAQLRYQENTLVFIFIALVVWLLILLPVAYFDQPGTVFYCEQVSLEEDRNPVSEAVSFEYHPHKDSLYWTWFRPLKNSSENFCQFEVRYMHPILSFWNYKQRFAHERLKALWVQVYEGEEGDTYSLVLKLQKPEERLVLSQPMRLITVERQFEQLAEFFQERDEEQLFISSKEPLYVWLGLFPVFLLLICFLLFAFMRRLRPCSSVVWHFDRAAGRIAIRSYGPLGGCHESEFDFQSVQSIALKSFDQDLEKNKGHFVMRYLNGVESVIGQTTLRPASSQAQAAYLVEAELKRWLEEKA